MFVEPYILERVKREFGKNQGIPPECKFMVWTGRYMAHEPNIFETPPMWEYDWHPPQDHGSGSDSNDEGVWALDGPQFNQDYMTWWARAIPDPLGFYGLERLAKATEGDADEEEEEEEGDDEEEQDVEMEDAPQHEEQGGLNFPIGIPIAETQQ